MKLRCAWTRRSALQRNSCSARERIPPPAPRCVDHEHAVLDPKPMLSGEDHLNEFQHKPARFPFVLFVCAVLDEPQLAVADLERFTLPIFEVAGGARAVRTVMPCWPG